MSVQPTGSADADRGTIEHYRMPDAGEGLTEAEIVTWRVVVGDTVDVNDIVVEVETAKSLVELPCPFAGTVAELLADVGDTVAVGTPILAVRTGGAPAGDAAGGDGAAGDAAGSDRTRGDARQQDAHPDDEPAEPAVGDAAPADSSGVPSGTPGGQDDAVGDGDTDGPVGDPGAPVGPSAETAAHPSTQAAAGAGRTAVLVGYGPAAGATRRRARRTAAAAVEQAPAAVSEAVAETVGTGAARSEAPVTGPERTGTDASGRVTVLCKPPVRKLAKDLGVDLAQVEPDEDGIVRRSAVEAVAARLQAGDAPEPADGGRTAPASGTGREDRRVPVKGVRRRTAEAMVASAFTAPHVTEWVQVDVTESVRLLGRLRADRSMRELRLSPFTLVARAMCLAARRHPEVNVSWDGDADEIVVHGRVGLGFAAATERGLVVPVVQDADALDLAGLARQVGELVDTARAGRLQPAQQAGCTLTVTNVGVFGVDGGTPILPPGTGLILACGQVRRMPWVVGTGETEQVVPRDVMTLAVSFDHRMIDGELGSRYLADVGRLMEDPGYGLAWA